MIIDQVLIIENNPVFTRLIQRNIQAKFHCKIEIASTFKSAQKIIAESIDPFFAAIIDLNLSDASESEILNLTTSKNIPTIVLAASYTDNIRETIFKFNIVDYVLKENIRSVDNILITLQRLLLNQNINILLISQKNQISETTKTLLEQHNYNIIEAYTGEKAIELIEDKQEINLIITDLDIPQMDGFELTSRIREDFDRYTLPILALISRSNQETIPHILKKGANDYILYPFKPEEIYCRINNIVEYTEKSQTLKENLSKDYLTNLYNRLSFFDIGQKFYDKSKKGYFSIAVGILSIDHLKQINDTLGHEAGDITIKHIASLLLQNLRHPVDVIARFGGEDFCVLLTNVSSEQAEFMFEKIKVIVANSEIFYANNTIKITLSIGSTSKLSTSLDAMVNTAESQLKKAKDLGRNKLVHS